MSEYIKVFDNPYPDGWKNLPSEETPITADALQEHTDAIENIEQYLEDNPIKDATDVEWNQVQKDGTKIAEITIDGETQEVFAPQGGGGTAEFVEMTKAQYDALPDSKYTDNVPRLITDYTEGGGGEAGKFKILTIDSPMNEEGILNVLKDNEGYECSGFFYNTDVSSYCEFEGLYVGKQVSGETIHFGYCHIRGLHQSDYEVDYRIDDEDGDTWYKSKSGQEIYDDTERVIGTYYGKPLYRKLVSISALPSSATTQSYPHHIENIDHILSFNSFHHFSGESVANGTNLSFSGTSMYASGCFNVTVDRTNVNIAVGQNRNNVSCEVIIKYTKTTD